MRITWFFISLGIIEQQLAEHPTDDDKRDG